ncbi:MAG: DUF86 domain-containing protein [Tannerella sp.]|nr:DUF86 domain-containing protein [Tannerella sp.]
MNSKDLFRLEHIRDSIEKIEYLSQMLHTQDSFESKWIEQDAIIRNLEIIGEAVIHISDGLKQRYPDVAWQEMKGMRNFVTHQYFGVELSEIWATVVNDIPLLKRQIQQILTDF